MQTTEELTDKQVVAVDGKTLRRSYKRNDRQSTLHMISAFATKNGVVLGQRRTDEKSNEITAVPELLEHTFSLVFTQDYWSRHLLPFGEWQRAVAVSLLYKLGQRISSGICRHSACPLGH